MNRVQNQKLKRLINLWIDRQDQFVTAQFPPTSDKKITRADMLASLAQERVYAYMEKITADSKKASSSSAKKNKVKTSSDVLAPTHEQLMMLGPRYW